MKPALFFCLIVPVCLIPCTTDAGGEDPLEDRIEHLEEHLFVVDAQLGKLEMALLHHLVM